LTGFAAFRGSVRCGKYASKVRSREGGNRREPAQSYRHTQLRLLPVSVGYVYVLSNPMIRGLLKVGFTCGSVDKRRRELSGATGVPSEFVIEYFQLSEDVEDIESLMHAELESYRIGENREFFKAPISEVISAIQRHARSPAIRFQRSEDDVDDINGNVYSCRRCGFQYAKSRPLELCPSCSF
jgi:hypothetical protein